MMLVTPPVDSPWWLYRRCRQQERYPPEWERCLPADDLVASLHRPALLTAGFREAGAASRRRHDATVPAIR